MWEENYPVKSELVHIAESQAANQLTVYVSSLFAECNFDFRKEKKVRENF